MSKASVPAERLEALAKDMEKPPYPPTDSSGICLDCGRWTPAKHPEAHDHKEWCTANREYAERRNYKARLRALLAEGPGLREALEKVTVRMNKVTARWRHTRSIAKAEMDALCNIQLEAEAALARVEGEKK